MPAVYIMSNKKNGTLYIGMASELVSRVQQHKDKIVDGFTKKYKLDQLVYYELYETYDEALIREKRMKEWRRQQKMDLIDAFNPIWKDLTSEIEELT